MAIDWTPSRFVVDYDGGDSGDNDDTINEITTIINKALLIQDIAMKEFIVSLNELNTTLSSNNNGTQGKYWIRGNWYSLFIYYPSMHQNYIKVIEILFSHTLENHFATDTIHGRSYKKFIDRGSYIFRGPYWIV